MNIQEKLGIKGELTLSVRDKSGKVKKLWNENWLGRFIRTYLGLDLQGVSLLGNWGDNLKILNTTTNTGFAGCASRFNGADAEAAFTYLAVGTGTTAAAATDTALEAEITTGGLERASATCTRVTTTQTNDTAQLDKTWTASASHAVTEAGAFNAASAGVMAGRQVFTAVNLVSGDTLQVVYKFKFA